MALPCNRRLPQWLAGNVKAQRQERVLKARNSDLAKVLKEMVPLT